MHVLGSSRPRIALKPKTLESTIRVSIFSHCSTPCHALAIVNGIVSDSIVVFILAIDNLVATTESPPRKRKIGNFSVCHKPKLNSFIKFASFSVKIIAPSICPCNILNIMAEFSTYVRKRGRKSRR